MTIHTGQLVELRVDTTISLVGATETKIKYRKPNGETGTWDATVDGDELVYETQAADLNKAGLWKIQSLVTQDGPRIGKEGAMQVTQAL